MAKREERVLDYVASVRCPLCGEGLAEKARIRIGLKIVHKELEEKGLFRFVEMLTPTSKGDLMNLSRELTKNALDMGARRIALDTITPFLMISPSIEARAILHNAVKTISRELIGLRLGVDQRTL